MDLGGSQADRAASQSWSSPGDEGWRAAEAAAAANTAGIRCVTGVEISVTWEHRTLHVIGLNFDAGNAALNTGLARLQTIRSGRAKDIGRRLEARGIHGAYAGARRLSGNDNVTRAHFAQWLCNNGHAGTLQKAFRQMLAHGKPGFVSTVWAGLEESIGWIHAAGGRAVLAGYDWGGRAACIVAALWPLRSVLPGALKRMLTSLPARAWAMSVMPSVTVPSSSNRAQTSRSRSYARSGGTSQPR